MCVPVPAGAGRGPRRSRAGAPEHTLGQPTELIVQKSEQFRLMMNSNGIMK
jgi:hypothetical protein